MMPRRKPEPLSTSGFIGADPLRTGRFGATLPKPEPDWLGRTAMTRTYSLMKKQFEVGYGRPPKASRFKPGQSGNPSGRPKGRTGLATDLAAELGEPVTVRENGRSRRVSKQRALIKGLMAKALDGDVRATAALLALYARLIVEPPEEDAGPLAAEELVILRRFGPRLLKSLAQKEGDGDD